jgi:hypothetical protein
MSEAQLTEAERMWLGGRPLEAGRALAALVPENERVRWAGRVLTWAFERSRIAAEPAVAAVIAATQEPTSPEDAATVFRAIEEALERAERSGRFDSLHEAVLTLARNAARIIPGAAPEPPDPRLAWWFVASLKCVGDELEEEFAAEAWPVLARW